MANPLSGLFGGKSPAAARPSFAAPAERSASPGGFANAAKRNQLISRLSLANGSPRKTLEALASIDPDGGGEFMTEGDVWALLSHLGVIGVSVQPMFSFLDVIAAATNAISETLTTLPGMVLVIQFDSKGVDIAAAGGIVNSIPTFLTTGKVGNNLLNGGQQIPFRTSGTAKGSGLLVYEITDADIGGPTLTGTVDCTFVTADLGPIKSSVFASMAAAQAWLDLTRC